MTGADEAVIAARAVMAAHFAALNARGEEALARTLHFPHYRLSGGVLRTWDGPDTYFGDFLERAEDAWDHSVLDRVDVVAAEADKVHLDVRFTRCGADGRALGSYRSLWVVARINGRWAAQLRSSFAA